MGAKAAGELRKEIGQINERDDKDIVTEDNC